MEFHWTEFDGQQGVSALDVYVTIICVASAMLTLVGCGLLVDVLI